MLDNVSEESSCQDILQPITKFYPPNELLSSDYAPDEKPILKLIKPEEPTYIVTCQELKKKYNNLFNTDDNLGYHYSSILYNQIIFLKMNNQNYMKHKNNKTVIKYLSGVFLPPEKIQSQDLKNCRNVYKTLPDVQFVDYKLNPMESFGRNSKPKGKDPRFSSNFESGNLFIAIKKKQFEYDLFLQNDINSKGNTQWFYFAVEFKQEGAYKFNILNFTKTYSLYEEGMRILYCSEMDSDKAKWVKGCCPIKYSPSEVIREDSESKSYYCLSFTYENIYSSDKVTFAYSYPYTNLDLERFFKRVVFRKINAHMKMEKIKVCQSLSGLPLYSFVIQHKKAFKLENQTNSFQIRKTSNLKESCCIVFMARQHSGQTQGSFITQGIIQFLMQSGENDYLKKNFTYVILPMINVDGVLYGNYRTNLSGSDLNRVWRFPNKDIHPQVYYVKKYLQNINKTYPISILIDIHGHSRSMNSFFYGNPQKKEQIHPLEDPRLFPYFCSKRIKQVSYPQSTFFISEEKKNSARVVLSQLFPKALVYTFENSFYGWMKDNNTIQEYSSDMLKKIGRDLILTYLEYDRLSDKNPQIKEKWTKEIYDMKNRKQSQKSNDDQGNSDSQAQFELINILNQQKEQYRKQEQEMSIFNNESQKKTIFRKSVAEYSAKKNLSLQRTLIEKRKKNNSPPPLIAQTINSDPLKERDNPPLSSHSHGFLSIVKIKPNGESFSEIGLKKKENLGCFKNELSSPRKMEHKEWAIQKLKRKKIKIEEAMNSCSGMKSFLRAMGIPLEKKF